VLCGGAAINPSFIRNAAFVDDDRTTLYEPGVWYCKDAFEGLAAVEALLGSEREAFVRRRLDEVREGVAKRAALEERAKTLRPAARPGPSRAVDVPAPAFLGVKVIDRIPLAELYELIDLNTLYRLHWGAKNASGETWERLVRQEFEPRLERLKREALAGGQVRVRAAYGFFPAAAEGDDVVVYDPEQPGWELERLRFPRQADRERLCLADYVSPTSTSTSTSPTSTSPTSTSTSTSPTSTSTSTSGGEGESVGVAVAAAAGAVTRLDSSSAGPGGGPSPKSKSNSKSPDSVGFLIVSVSDTLLERSDSMMKGGQYTEGYYLHGFGVRLAEAAAEWVHRRMRREWGIEEGRGLRYAWGYPACPDHMQHEVVFRLLPARERLAMDLTSAGALVPELSTAAIVFHHPEAKYFSAG
jgi:5-methyltetrahydrofolate--homocysteine methyltransferase